MVGSAGGRGRARDIRRRSDVELNGLGFNGNVPDSKADQVGVRYGYNFSKRTEGYAMYTKRKNGSNAYHDFAVNPIGLDGSAGTAVAAVSCGSVVAPER